MNREATETQNENETDTGDDERAWHALEIDEIVEELDTDLDSGISSDDAQQRLERHGPNEVAREEGTPWWRTLLSQFQNPLIYILMVAGVVALVGLIASQLTLVVVPAVLALFPATLLVPVSGRLKQAGLPPALAAFISLLAGLLVIGAIIGAMVPLVIAEVPDLVESASEGVQQIEQFLEDGPFGLEVPGVAELLEMAREQFADAAGDIAAQAVDVAVVAFETVAGLLLLFVALFFYCKDGQRLADGVISTLPQANQPRARRIAYRSWETLGKFFRGQLLVALVDATFIGIGLLLLGVPLALPLAVLILFGGLFPIVGAVATGTLAVLVALADAGLATGLIVLGLVLAVQQLESNVLEPIILGRAIELHPLVVLLSITAGAVTLGILGAFLAVPVAAIVAVVVGNLREDIPDPTEEEPAEGGAEDEPQDAEHPDRAQGARSGVDGRTGGSDEDGSGRGRTGREGSRPARP